MESDSRAASDVVKARKLIDKVCLRAHSIQIFRRIAFLTKLLVYRHPRISSTISPATEAGLKRNLIVDALRQRSKAS